MVALWLHDFIEAIVSRLSYDTANDRGHNKCLSFYITGIVGIVFPHSIRLLQYFNVMAYLTLNWPLLLLQLDDIISGSTGTKIINIRFKICSTHYIFYAFSFNPMSTDYI